MVSSNSSKKRTKEFDISSTVRQKKPNSFVFWKNRLLEKNITTLSDLYENPWIWKTIYGADVYIKGYCLDSCFLTHLTKLMLMMYMCYRVGSTDNITVSYSLLPCCHKVHFIYTMLHEQETIQDMLLRIRKQKYDKSLVINQG